MYCLNPPLSEPPEGIKYDSYINICIPSYMAWSNILCILLIYKYMIVGSWSCHLCIAEFHGGKIPEHMKQQ